VRLINYIKEKEMFEKLFKLSIAIQIALVVTMLFATPAAAAELRGYENIIIATGDVVNDDLYLAGNRIVINGTVNGDVLAVGETITVAGRVDGDIIAIGSKITIDGEVTGSVRVGGGNINIGGTIGEDLVVAGGDVDITEATEIGRDLVFGAENIRIDALIGSDILGAAELVNLANVVGGSSEIFVDRLIIASTASIKGDLIYTSEKQADIQPGAQIEGKITHKIPEQVEWDWDFTPAMHAWGRVIAYLMALLVGILIILIAPRKSTEVVTAIKNKSLMSLGLGALVLFVTPVAILITFLTIIGIPLGILVMFLYGIMIFLSQLVVGLFIGYLIINRFHEVESKGVLIGALALGFAILALLKLIPVVGFILWWITVLFGMGATATTVIKKKESGVTAEVTESG